MDQIPSELTSRARLAAMLGVTPRTVLDLANDGLVFRQGRQYVLDASVLSYIRYLKTGHRAPRAAAPAASQDDAPPDIDTLLDRARNAPDKNAAQMVKVQIDALRSGYSLEVEQGRYIARDRLREGLLQTFTAMRSAILAMPGELPPHLEGLPAADVEVQLRTYADRLITDIRDSLDKIADAAQAAEAPPPPSPKMAKPRGRPKKPKP